MSFLLTRSLNYSLICFYIIALRPLFFVSLKNSFSFSLDSWLEALIDVWVFFGLFVRWGDKLTDLPFDSGLIRVLDIRQNWFCGGDDNFDFWGNSDMFAIGKVSELNGPYLLLLLFLLDFLSFNAKSSSFGVNLSSLWVSILLFIICSALSSSISLFSFSIS